MAGPIVFPEPSTPRDGRLGGSEPVVNFYLESTRPQAVAARAWVNAAFERFPDPAGVLAGRLRSTEYIEHTSAMDELFVHDQLLRHGLVVHEEGGRGPDFRLYRDGEYLAAVEVCSLFDEKAWQAELQRHSRITDELNRLIRLDRWFIHFQVIRLDRTPSARRLVDWVNAQIAALPTDAATAAADPTPWMTYRTDGVELNFRFLPRRSDTPPRPTDRIVGFGPFIGGFVSSYQRLRSALEKKVQKRYDTRDKPFAIFIGVHDGACTLDQLEDALLGDEQVLVDALASRRANNGFYGRNRDRPDGKHRDVSCVITAPGWRPGQPEEPSFHRYDNPFAAAPFPDDVLPAMFRLHGVRDDNGIRLEWTPTPPGNV